ncbi:MAG: histidinol dehydrogenase, partial [Balneolaceae bacterium]
MKLYTYKDLPPEKITALIRRPKMDFASVFGTVQPILDDVEKNGNSAIQRFNQKFDGVRPDPLVTDPASVETSLDEPVCDAINTAMQNIYRFHREQFTMDLEVETMSGVVCRRVAKPIERVG